MDEQTKEPRLCETHKTALDRWGICDTWDRMVDELVRKRLARGTSRRLVKRLYLVKTRGLDPSYALANDPAEAYDKVKRWLDRNNYGFSKDRVLESVTLIADVSQYADTPARLYL